MVRATTQLAYTELAMMVAQMRSDMITMREGCEKAIAELAAENMALKARVSELE